MSILERGNIMRKKNFVITGILICVAVIGFGVFYYFNILPANKIINEVRKSEIINIDLNQIAEGNYIGEFSYNKSHCKVEVIVNDHKIEDIRILENGKTDHAKKAEAVIIKVIAEQKINVDVVSGATTTSKALLKAVESALSSGLKK